MKTSSSFPGESPATSLRERSRSTDPLSTSYQSRDTGADNIRQWALLVAPPILTGSMLVAFRCLRAVLGPKVGYFTAFVCYWLVWCLAFPLWIMRGTPFSRLFRRPSHPLGKPAWLGLILLLFPALGAAVTIFARRLRLATPLVLLSSAALAIVNAIGEEVLWRGIYPHVFPRQVTKGQAALVKFVPYICVCYHPHLSIHQPQILLSYFIPTTI